MPIHISHSGVKLEQESEKSLVYSRSKMRLSQQGEPPSPPPRVGPNGKVINSGEAEKHQTSRRRQYDPLGDMHSVLHLEVWRTKYSHQGEQKKVVVGAHRKQHDRKSNDQLTASAAPTDRNQKDDIDARTAKVVRSFRLGRKLALHESEGYGMLKDRARAGESRLASIRAGSSLASHALPHSALESGKWEVEKAKAGKATTSMLFGDFNVSRAHRSRH